VNPARGALRETAPATRSTRDPVGRRCRPVPRKPQSGVNQVVNIGPSPVENLSYRLIFAPAEPAREQAVTLHALTGTDARDHLATGELLAEGHTTKLATDAGGRRQINREGHPMVWPIFRPVDSEWLVDSEWAGTANMGHPQTDIDDEGDRIAKLVAGVVGANGTCGDPVA
jgi:hypothetical protein